MPTNSHALLQKDICSKKPIAGLTYNLKQEQGKELLENMDLAEKTSSMKPVQILTVTVTMKHYSGEIIHDPV